MNLPKIALSLGSLCLLGLAGCGKPETASAPATPPAAQPTSPAPVAPPPAVAPPTPAAVSAPQVPAAAVAAVDAGKATVVDGIAAARASLAGLKLPDFQTASTSQLAGLATQALTLWHSTVEAPAPGLTGTVDSIKTALGANQAMNALSSLTSLGTQAKGIPGGDTTLQTVKQLVGAWALKQGFDAASIGGILGALQRGDYAGLGTQAVSLFAKGGVTGEQKGLLDGVLGTFGLSAGKAGGAVDAVRGLLGK